MNAATTDNATEAQVAAALARCAAGERSALRVIYDLEAPAWSAWRGACCAGRTWPKRRCRTPSCGCGGRPRTFDPQKGAARTWLYAILRNCALSILRDESRFSSDEDVVRTGRADDRERAGTAAGNQRAAALPGAARYRSVARWWCCPMCMGSRTANWPASSACRSAR